MKQSKNKGIRGCFEEGEPHFLSLKIVPFPALTLIFCRFQQISLMLTLRSNVTQPRRKNLNKKKHHHNSRFVEVMLAINPPQHLFSNVSRVALLSIPHLLSGWGSDSATRIKPGYLLQSWKKRKRNPIWCFKDSLPPSVSMSLSLYLHKEKLTKSLRVTAYENKWCKKNQPLKATGPWEGGLSNQRNRNVCQKQCQIIFSPPHTSTPLRMEPGCHPCPQCRFSSHRNYLSSHSQKLSQPGRCWVRCCA